MSSVHQTAGARALVGVLVILVLNGRHWWCVQLFAKVLQGGVTFDMGGCNLRKQQGLHNRHANESASLSSNYQNGFAPVPWSERRDACACFREAEGELLYRTAMLQR